MLADLAPADGPGQVAWPVSRPAYHPRCYRLPPHKPLPSREALVLWIGLQPLWQVADIWPLRPADNRPNPCGTQFPHPNAGSHSTTEVPFIAIPPPDYLHPALHPSAGRANVLPSQAEEANLYDVGRAALPVKSAETQRCLHSFPCEIRMHGLSWRERDQQPLAIQGTNSGTHPGEVPAARLKAEAHLCTASYLRPHHGAGGFRTAAQVPP
jgi:hypothetical protein